MKLSSYERVTRRLAIIFMISGIAIWVYLFHSFFDMMFKYDIHFSLLEIFDGWYAQILQILTEIVGIALLLIFRRKGLPIILGVCASVIAVECLLDAYLLLVEYKQYDYKDFAFFFNGAASLIIAVMLLFNALLYSTGSTKSATLIKYAAISLLLLQILSIIIEIRDPEVSMEIMFLEREFDIPSYLMLFLVLHMSVSKYTKQISFMGVATTSIRNLRSSLMVEGAGIGRDIAYRFSDYNKNGLWCDSYSFILTTFNQDRLSMDISPADGRMVCRISSVENGTGMNIFRFDLSGVWFDTGDASTCDVMRFYGYDGMFVQLIVREPFRTRAKGVPKVAAVKLISREEGTTSHKISMKAKAAMDFLKKHTAKFRNFIRTEVIGRIRKKE